MEIHTKIRKIRLEKDLTIKKLGERAGLSNGFISQVERGVTKPSMESLKKITTALGITMANLFEDTFDASSLASSAQELRDIDNVKVVKRDRRKKLILPKGEIMYHLLSPDLNRKIEFILLEIERGGESGDEHYAHEGEECGIVLKGKLELIIDNKSYILEEGDSIYFPSNLMHGWRNVGDDRVMAVWAITPPSL
ncbi:MAG: helix-turn-helix domain-containing protein [Candidatus Hodarchaeota archaeon]